MVEGHSMFVVQGAKNARGYLSARRCASRPATGKEFPSESVGYRYPLDRNTAARN